MKAIFKNKTESLNQLIIKYFSLIQDKDVNNLLELFTDDAIVYEPFSKMLQGLHGKTQIESFFRIMILSCDNVNWEISIEYMNINSTKNEVISVLVIFVKEGKLKARFIFEITSKNKDKKKIKTLDIRFIE